MKPRSALVVDLVALAAGAVLLMLAGVPGWILLAAAGGIIATRGWARVAVAIVTMAIAGALAAWGASGGHPLAIAGGLVAAVAAGWAAVAGRGWPAMGARYERTAPADLSDWDALDAGLDPTDPQAPQG